MDIRGTVNDFNIFKSIFEHVIRSTVEINTLLSVNMGGKNLCEVMVNICFS